MLSISRPRELIDKVRVDLHLRRDAV